MNTQHSASQPEHPKDTPRSSPPPDPGALPHALVFFLTADQRRRVLASLRVVSESREQALLSKLGVENQ